MFVVIDTWQVLFVVCCRHLAGTAGQLSAVRRPRHPGSPFLIFLISSSLWVTHRVEMMLLPCTLLSSLFLSFQWKTINQFQAMVARWCQASPGLEGSR